VFTGMPLMTVEENYITEEPCRTTERYTEQVAKQRIRFT